jgi:hypothetical protein
MPRRDTESPRKFLIPNASGASTAQPKRKMEAVRAKRLQANPTRRPRIKRRPPLAASVLPLALSRSHARVTGESYSRPRAIRSPSLPRQRRRGKAVFPLVLAPDFDRTKRSFVDKLFDWSPRQLPLGVTFFRVDFAFGSLYYSVHVGPAVRIGCLLCCEPSRTSRD